MSYRFDLLDETGGNADAATLRQALAERPFTRWPTSLEDDAPRFAPGKSLIQAINTAIAVGEPLLITGDPGTGKTQAAYYAAWRLGITPVLHFQVKSETAARDLLYHFDAVRYFHDATLLKDSILPEKRAFVEKRALWEAFDSDHARLVLIDEIDKAPRDFPNDLLFELDRMKFQVAETQEWVQAPPERRPIVVITSNSERRLPDPFLRRCVYHHIEFNEELLDRAVKARRDEFATLPQGLVDLAIERFLRLREYDLRKRPATGECLVWLRILARAAEMLPSTLEADLAKARDDSASLPYLSTLLKDHQDGVDLREGRLGRPG